MTAEIQCNDRKIREFSLDDKCELFSHYKDNEEYDSSLIDKFTSSFEKLGSPWQIESESKIVNLKDTVFIPDFIFRHKEDDRIVYLEIVGFWSPGYLKRKFRLLKKTRVNTIVAISRDLNVSEEKIQELPVRHVYYKTAINSKKILEILEEMQDKWTWKDYFV